AELYLINQRLGELDRLHRLLEALLLCDLQLVLEMDRRGGEEGVETRAIGMLERGCGALDVQPGRSGEPGDHWTPDLPSDRRDGVEVVRRADREARFDDVHPERLELMRHTQLLGRRHGGARRLLAIAERSVEDLDPRHLH